MQLTWFSPHHTWKKSHFWSIRVIFSYMICRNERNSLLILEVQQPCPRACPKMIFGRPMPSSTMVIMICDILGAQATSILVVTSWKKTWASCSASCLFIKICDESKKRRLRKLLLNVQRISNNILEVETHCHQTNVTDLPYLTKFSFETLFV